MAIIYYPISSSMYVRDTSNPNYQQLVLSLNPNTILYFDATSSLLNTISASTIEITSSMAISASYASNGGGIGGGTDVLMVQVFS